MTSRDESQSNAGGEAGGSGAQQSLNLGSGFGGFDNNNMNGGSFSGMHFGAGNLDQMQMMMNMQTGMPNNGFGSFPMMGSFPPSFFFKPFTISFVSICP